MELNSELERLEKYKPIENELQRAKKLHPVWPENIYHQLSIITEEIGEVGKAINDQNFEMCNDDIDFLEIRTELIQTAAMCMRMLENLPS